MTEHARILCREPGRHSTLDKGHEEGGSAGASQGGHAVPLSRGGRAGPGGRWRAPVAAVARVRARVPFPLPRAVGGRRRARGRRRGPCALPFFPGGSGRPAVPPALGLRRACRPGEVRFNYVQLQETSLFNFQLLSSVSPEVWRLESCNCIPQIPLQLWVLDAL